MPGNDYICFWGVRGSHAAPQKTHLGVGGNTSCVEMCLGGHLVICDAGTGIIPLGKELISRNTTNELLIILTHYHWDHICGLPFFEPAFLTDWKIRFFGPGNNKEEIQQNLKSQMQDPYFPVSVESWMSEISFVDPNEMFIESETYSINRFGVHHPGQTYGYRILAKGKHIVYVSDNECQYIDSKKTPPEWNRYDTSERDLLYQIQAEEYQTELNGIRDADVLIHDAQYTPDEYKKKHGWGHSCYVDIVNVAIDADVKSLYLYHHDPYSDDQDVAKIHEDCLRIIESRGASMHCHIAKEGLTIEL